jgi:t-SNARE complex subunit (syntaxin)
MNDYNQVQLGYRQKCKERIQRQLEISELILLLLLLLLLL